MARTDLQECGKILPTVSGNNKRSHGKIFPRSQIHKNSSNKIHNNKINKSQQQSNTDDIMPNQNTKEIHILDQPISKLYTDDCGRFQIWSRSGNEYTMIAYHCDSNTILQAPFFNRKDKHRIRAYNPIMQKLADRGHHIDIQILDN